MAQILFFPQNNIILTPDSLIEEEWLKMASSGQMQAANEENLWF